MTTIAELTEQRVAEMAAQIKKSSPWVVGELLALSVYAAMFGAYSPTNPNDARNLDLCRRQAQAVAQ